jgi:hypothetical protein
MSENSIEALKQEMVSALRLRPDEQRAEFTIAPRGGDADGEWVAQVSLIDDYVTEKSGPYLDIWCVIRASHRSELGAMQKLYAAVLRIKGDPPFAGYAGEVEIV